ncbi:1-phosphofructokinase family hexose kinase [Leucobacter japonicus]|uniref:1-phosphofructokinase family hexose kinase n=1 Tax=Leucobacter japonicus TaxID=1461259 RepID=UPI00094998C6|nr:hexose kinase [Leucobacter japonicus]
MLITVTPAPAIDWTLECADFAFGLVHRARAERREPSGKGVNVSVALQRAGVPTHAVIAASGEGTDFMGGALDALNVAHTFTPGGPVRTNVTLLVDGHPDTKINTSGVALDAAACDALVEGIAAFPDADAVLAAGSLPPGTDAELHARLVTRARELGRYTAVDTSGHALAAAVRAAPDLIKPNAHELAELTGASLRTFGDVRDAARGVREQFGIGTVLVSLGADGALLVDGVGEIWAGARPDAVVNAVGAGDAMLAGFLAARADRAEAIRTAVRWGASAVAHPTTLFAVLPEHRLEQWSTVEIDWTRAIQSDSD